MKNGHAVVLQKKSLDVMDRSILAEDFSHPLLFLDATDRTKYCGYFLLGSGRLDFGPFQVQSRVFLDKKRGGGCHYPQFYLKREPDVVVLNHD